MKEVVISITSIQETEGHESTSVEFMTGGLYERRGRLAYIDYTESELTGLEGTRTLISAAPDSVTVKRDGAVSSVMEFEVGKKHLFAYSTPFGAMTMGVDTFSVASSLGENGGTLEVRYAVDMDGSRVSKNTFRITVKETAADEPPLP